MIAEVGEEDLSTLDSPYTGGELAVFDVGGCIHAIRYHLPLISHDV